MNTTIDEFAQRPRRAFESDGIFDVMTGLLVLGMTFVNLLQDSHTWYGWAASLVLLFTAMIFLPRGAKILKERYSQPKLGYIALRHGPSIKMIIITGFGTMLLVLVLAWVYSQQHLVRVLHLKGKMFLVDIGVLVGIAFIIHFIRLRFIRHLVVAGITIICAFLLALSPLRLQSAYFLLSLVFSLSMVIAGAIPFIKMLHAPLVTDQEIE